MNPNLRAIISGLLAAGLSIWVGVAVAHEERLIPFMATGVAAWALLAWWRGPRAEAWLLAFLIFGYVLGNRGFAQIRPLAELPLFFGELGLAIGGTLVVLRHALLRTLPVRRDWLHGLLLLWIALGAGRMLFDVRSFGLVALRDFATVYYAGFFFIAFAVMQHEASRRLLTTAFTVTFALLPPLALLFELFPDFFLRHLQIAGTPLIYYKDDLLATFLFTGFLWLLPRRTSGDRRTTSVQWFFALFALVMGLGQLSRAGMVGLVVSIAWLARGGYWRPARTVLAVAASGVLLLSLLSLFEGRDFAQTKVYAIYEHAVSIVDIGGRRHYRNQESVDSGDNNRFRLVWWKSVVDETLAGNPLVGLGFGYDLARNFVLTYDPLMANDFTARSPHSVVVTTFGRMGAVGLVALLAFFSVLALRTARLAAAARRHASETALEKLNANAVGWVVVLSACFGVVLEGPMGAIPFWILLALAQQPGEDQDATAQLHRGHPGVYSQSSS